MVILPDRCTISELKGRFRGGIKTNKDDKDFLDFFSGPGVRINLLLYALEGNLRKNPGILANVIEQQYSEVCAALRSALPNAQLLPEDSGAVRGVLWMALDTQASIERKQVFLTSIAPQLQAPVSDHKKPQLWEDVLINAERFGVVKNLRSVF